MKNPFVALIPALSTYLDTVKGDWAVSDGFGPATQSGNAIVIGSRSANQDQDKNTFDTTCSVTIEVIARGASFGYKRAQDKADAIMAGLDSDQLLDLGSDFTCDTIVLASVNNREGLNQSDNEFSLILRYEFQITQN